MGSQLTKRKIGNRCPQKQMQDFSTVTLVGTTTTIAQRENADVIQMPALVEEKCSFRLEGRRHEMLDAVTTWGPIPRVLH